MVAGAERGLSLASQPGGFLVSLPVGVGPGGGIGGSLAGLCRTLAGGNRPLNRLVGTLVFLRLFGPLGVYGALHDLEPGRGLLLKRGDSLTYCRRGLPPGRIDAPLIDCKSVLQPRDDRV